MGGQTSSTMQQQATPLQQSFGASQGYQQMPVQQIQAPQYPAALTPTPQQAAQQTVARMLARTPPVMPAAPTAPKYPVELRGATDRTGGR